jgi:hypothetical protein
MIPAAQADTLADLFRRCRADVTLGVPVDTT